ncbi:MAG: hypothetical protein JW874_07430 [Spirochaetales bacterium]|nr:hypothetical protein [Spirochaetales bacterium]
MNKGGLLYMAGTILLLCLLLFCCAFTDSENVETSGIWAAYSVEYRSESDIRVYAALRVGGPTGTVLTLSGEESIFCNGVRLTEGVLNYYANFDTPATDETYTFVFDRGEETVTDIIMVPESPGEVTTVPETDYNEWDALDVNWDNSGSDRIQIVISGSDIYTYTGSPAGDTGTYTVNEPKGSGLTSIENANAGPISVSVRRVREGTVNTAYQGGVLRSERWSEDTVIAHFQPKLTLTVTVDPEYSGMVTSTGSISGTDTSMNMYRKYEPGEDVSLSAEPLSGWAFEGWSGDLSGENNPGTITSMSTHMSVTALFGPPSP